MLVQDLASDSPSLSHPFGHWAEPGWFLWLISSRLISLCLGTVWAVEISVCLDITKSFELESAVSNTESLLCAGKPWGNGVYSSVWEGTSEVLCSAHILEPEVWECASSPSPSFVFYFILFFSILFYSILFQFWQGVKCSDSPTLLASASGHEWAAGFLGARLIQLGMFQNHPVPSGKWSCHQSRVSSAQRQRSSFLLLYFLLVCGPFYCWQMFSRVVKPLCGTSWLCISNL